LEGAAGRGQRRPGESHLDRDVAGGEYHAVPEDLRQLNVTDPGAERVDLLFVSLRILHDGHRLAGVGNDDPD
jgi:hypothetical protein